MAMEDIKDKWCSVVLTWINLIQSVGQVKALRQNYSPERTEETRYT